MRYQKSNRRGEGKALVAFMEKCYQLYEQKTYQVAYYIVQDSGWAEDAVQDAFLKLMKGQVYFEDACSDDCKRYIITVIRNSAIDIYNKKKREQEMFCSCDEESYKEKAEMPKEDGEVQELMELISGLSSRYYEVVEFTLEREGGVEGLCYGQLDNESKGAWFAADAPFRFYFADCSENIFVDLEKSTEDILYCYDYMAVDLTDQAQELTLEIYQNHDEDVAALADTLLVPLSNQIGKKECTNAEGGRISLSSIAMNVDVNEGLGLDSIRACDPWNVYYVAIRYVDGTSYVVHEHGIDGIHSCEVEIENTGYVCGSEDGHLVFVFNRLVDIGKVESVIVNETVYTWK